MMLFTILDIIRTIYIIDKSRQKVICTYKIKLFFAEEQANAEVPVIETKK